MNCPACGEPHECRRPYTVEYHECFMCNAVFTSFGEIVSPREEALKE